MTVRYDSYFSYSSLPSTSIFQVFSLLLKESTKWGEKGKF